MSTDIHKLESLAARARQGDRAAVQSFRQQFECDMRAMVGHVLRTQTTATPLTRWILAAARRLAPRTREQETERERRITEIVRQLTESAVASLHSDSMGGKELLSTVRDSTDCSRNPSRCPGGAFGPDTQTERLGSHAGTTGR